MNGTRQKNKQAEYDVLYCRRRYCYLQRAGVAHRIKRVMRRRRRFAAKREPLDA